MSMIGVDEGKQVAASAVRILLTTTLIGAVMLLFVGTYAFYNGYFTKQTKYKTSGPSTVLVNMMQNNPMSVRSLYTALTELDEKDLYFICIKYPVGDTVNVRVFSHEGTDSDIEYSVSQTDREAFIESIKQQFGTDLEDGEYVQTPQSIVLTKAILHSFEDRMCEMYYNPAHSDGEVFYPPYMYIVVNNDLAGM